MKNYKLIAYALDFVSFLINKLDVEASKINAVYLFGSASRGEADADSDIDIFVDTDDKNLESKLENIKSEFYESSKFKNYWRLLRIENDFSFTVGALDEWEDLKRSIISSGIVLYSKYKEKFKGEIYAMFKIESKKKRSDNIRVWRMLYGYTQKVGKKAYTKKGLVKELGGAKLAQSLFVVPLEKADTVLKEIRSKKLKYKMIQIITDLPVRL